VVLEGKRVEGAKLDALVERYRWRGRRAAPRREKKT